MSLFVFNNSQQLIKSIPDDDLISLVQEQEINKTDTLFVEVPVNVWKELKEKAFYLAVQDPYERFSFHMYKLWKEDTQTDTVALEGIQIAFDELKAYGYIKDRRFSDSEPRTAAQAVVEGSGWELGYIDDTLPLVNTNFFYISRLEALSKLLEVTGAEVRFRVEITGNRIVSKRMDLYRELSEFKGKRFAYGSKLLEVVKQEDNAEIYTALVGRGKGEETDTGGFGRRITFEGVEWRRANGAPVDKPSGQEYVELPEMTALYGYPDGTPRTGIVEFQDTEEPELLLRQTYEALVTASRPKVQFKATVQTAGDMQLGETVAIIRKDLGFRYMTRVYKVRRDYLNNHYTEVDLGDKLSQTTGDLIKQIDTTINRRDDRLVQVIQTAANGKNKIFRGPEEPTTGMMVNDLWYKPVGEGETELYTWNGEIWELTKVSAGLLAGTLDAENGDVNLINVNVANIVGETSEFVQSWWNGINEWTYVDGNGINMQGYGAWRKNILTSTGTELFNGEGAYNKAGVIGYFKANLSESSRDEHIMERSGSRHSIGIGVNGTHDLVFGTSNLTSTDRVFYPRVMLKGDNGQMHIRTTVHPYQSNMGLSLTASDGTVEGQYGVMLEYGNGGIYFTADGGTFLKEYGKWKRFEPASMDQIGFRLSGEILADTVHNNLTISATNDMIFKNRLGNTKMELRENLDMHTGINMQGNAITNQSDIRLKTNVTDSNLDALREIERLRFIEYDWDKTKTVNAGKPEGRQFGIEAQYSPFLQTKAGDSESYLSVDMTRQVNLNSKAIQELWQKVKELEAKA